MVDEVIAWTEDITENFDWFLPSNTDPEIYESIAAIIVIYFLFFSLYREVHLRKPTAAVSGMFPDFFNNKKSPRSVSGGFQQVSG